MSETDEATTDRSTPPIPPTELNRYDDPGLGRKELSRERQDVGCLRCRRGVLYLVERRTGRRVIGTWPELEGDEYETTDDWPEVETVEICDCCSYRRQIA